MELNLPRGTRVRPRPGSQTAKMLGTDRGGVVDLASQDQHGTEHIWVLLDGGGYLQGEADTEWQAIDG